MHTFNINRPKSHDVLMILPESVSGFSYITSVLQHFALSSFYNIEKLDSY